MESFIPQRSIELKNITTALCKFQEEFTTVDKNRQGRFMYADLPHIIESTRPSLTKNGLSVTQEFVQVAEQSLIRTTLFHNSGEWIESYVIIPKPDLSSEKGIPFIQAFGKHITYMRRYAYSALLMISPGDDDTDGVTDQRYSSQNNYRQEYQDYVTKEQVEQLVFELNGYHDITRQVLEGLKIQSLAEVPKAKFQASIVRIRELKKLSK